MIPFCCSFFGLFFSLFLFLFADSSFIKVHVLVELGIIVGQEPRSS